MIARRLFYSALHVLVLVSYIIISIIWFLAFDAQSQSIILRVSALDQYFSDIDCILQCFPCYISLLSIQNGRSSKFVQLHTGIQFFNIISSTSFCIRWSIRNLSLNVLLFHLYVHEFSLFNLKLNQKIIFDFRIQSQRCLANFSTSPTDSFIGLLF